MKNKAFSSFIIMAVVAVLGVVSLTACEKDKETKVEVVVTEGVGFRAANATVRLYAKPTDTTRNDLIIRFDETKITDGSGVAVFDYTDYIKPGQSGFAVLDIEVNKTTGDGTTEGIGVVKVEENKVVSKSVHIE